ncbi:IS110 family transposase [Zhihengliuella salsuginis]|uniref:IS110 family transposase n=1 Tax=Zhihengliuella salsuginis TaxID=578222 RepID=A0ABQ3GL81_9MICC|nr:IS110 family transposase [Zhihengliuella salsuginis]GHD14023.1 IS110 family transposase [Zhihengliuella salsuginis]
MNQRTYVGLDVHARSILGCAIDQRTGEVLRQRLPGNNAGVVDWVKGLGPPVRVVYEAGPTGYGLCRALEAAGFTCVVAAPSKLQRPPGDRVKTDARDAEHLARLNLLDQFTPVTVPGTHREAARDLVRAREDVRADLMRARHRLSKLLLRHGIVYSGGRTWTNAHYAWLHRQCFEDPVLEATYDSCLETVELTLARRDGLDDRIRVLAESEPYADVVHALMCLRGISVLTAFGLTVEVGDWNRFTGKTIGAYLGLVPSEHSSGTTRSQGAITKTGNTHARRLLVEAAWHHRRRYQPSRDMQSRWDLADETSRVRGHQGNHRLHRQWEKFEARRKRRVIANVAVARELAGWCWSLAAPVQQEHPWPDE